MLAIAIQIPEFPANVRSDTYAVDYGRILGAAWMERSAGWETPSVTFETITWAERAATKDAEDDDDM